MGAIKKYAWVIFPLFILILFFFTRFYNILALPIFTDEAIYARWSQIASNDASWRFISLTDGKQPMFVWIAMILMKLIDDPLLAARTVSVIAGFFSMVGLFLLTNEIFKNKKLALLTSFMYVLYPLALVYDRMALYDSLVSMFIIWSLYFEILLVRYVRLDIALILGMIAGLGMLTKTNTNYALLLLPFLALLVDFKKKDWKKTIGKLAIFSLVAVFIANAMYLVLRLSPFFHIIAEKNYVFAYRPEEFFQAPFAHLLSNLGYLLDWLTIYMTWPFLILVVASFFINKKYFKERLLLFVWFIVPFLIAALIGRLLYPRYIFSMTIPLLILGSFALYYLMDFVKRFWLKSVIAIVFLAMFAINDYFIITDFAKAYIPKIDKIQYLTDWPSGVGVKETIAFLKEKSQTQKIYVGTQGTFGLMPYALELYFYNNPNVKIVGFWPINDTVPQEAITASKTMPTYFVFYQNCPSCSKMGIAPAGWKVTPVFRIERLEKERYYTLYEVKSDENK